MTVLGGDGGRLVTRPTGISAPGKLALPLLLLLLPIHVYTAYAQEDSPSHTLVARYHVVGNAFLLDRSLDIVVAELPVINSKPLMIAYIFGKEVYLLCTNNASRPVIKEVGEDKYLIITRCYLKLPLVWLLRGTVSVYNVSGEDKYLVDVQLSLKGMYVLQRSFRFNSSLDETIMNVVEGFERVLSVLNTYRVRLTIESRNSSHVVNGTPAGFNPFFITYPLTRLEAYRLEKMGASFDYFGLPVYVTPWELGTRDVVANWLIAYTDVLLGQPYIEVKDSVPFAEERLYFLSPSYRGQPVIRYLIFWAGGPLTSEQIRDVLVRANSSHVYSEDFVYNSITYPHTVSLSYSSQLNVIVHYRGNYPVHLIYVPIPAPEALQELGGRFLVLIVRSLYYEYPADLDPFAIDIGSVPEESEDTGYVGLLVVFIALLLAIALLARRVRAR